MCFDCGEQDDFDTDFRSGDIICRRCGVVVEGHIIDDRLERYEDVPRVDPSDAAPLLPEQHVFLDTTNIPKRFMATQDPYAAVREGFKIIDSIGGPLFSPNVMVSAKQLYRDLREHVKYVPSHSSKTFGAAALYFGCKMEGVCRSEKEIATICQVSKNQLTTACKAYKDHLRARPYAKQLFVGLKSKDLINRAVERLVLNAMDVVKVKKMAHEVDEKVTNHETLAGKTPGGICGGVILVSLRRCNIEISKGDVSRACNVATGTLDRMFDFITKLF